MKNYLKMALLLALSGFGLLTLFLTLSILFDWFGIRAMEGHYVPLVVWANLAAGLAYLAAARALWATNRRAVRILAIALLILVGGYAGLQWHIAAGGLHEAKTPLALLFRIGLTSLFLAGTYYYFNQQQSK